MSMRAFQSEQDLCFWGGGEKDVENCAYLWKILATSVWKVTRHVTCHSLSLPLFLASMGIVI